MYQLPCLSGPDSISLFLDRMREMTQSSRDLITRLIFVPARGSLDSLPIDENSVKLLHDKTDLINQAHSGLFRLLVHSRHQNTSVNSCHEVFRDFVNLFPNLLQIDEANMISIQRTSIEDSISQISDPTRILNIPRIIPSPDSNALKTLLKSCKDWLIGHKEWDALKPNIQLCIATCFFLIDSYDGEARPIWHLIGSDAVRTCRSLILRKCKDALNVISATLLLEVRFITLSSQRLLDCYSMIYFTALGISQTLEVEDLIECLEVQMYGHGRLKSMAIFIYDSLALIFQYPLYQNDAKLEVMFLRDSILTFPPKGLNRETVELIQTQYDACHFPDINESDADWESKLTLDLWCKWFNALVRWHKTNLQIEPVKELLRISLKKVDSFRAAQVRFIFKVASIRSSFYGLIN